MGQDQWYAAPHLDTEQCPFHSHCLVTPIIVYCVYILKSGNEEVMVEEKQEIVVMVIIVVRVWLTLSL